MNDIKDGISIEDLNDLRLAALNLGKMSEVYSTQALKLGNMPGTSTERYGRPHEWWDYVKEQLTSALRTTYDRLDAGQEALLKAIDAYAYVDGDNAGELTEVGAGYKKLLADPNGTDGDQFYESGEAHKNIDPPNLDDKPEGWEEDYDV